jgi:hypothetical protein
MVPAKAGIEGASGRDKPPRIEAVRRRQIAGPHPASLWRAACREIDSPASSAAPKKQTGRGSAGDGVAPLGIPGLLKAFRKAARTRLRRIRIVRLSRAAWGAPDAHLQTTLNLFDQPNSRASPGAHNNSRPAYSHRAAENSHSLGL